MSKVLIVLSMIFATSLCWATSIDIELDEDDCIDGWISMDVEVTVDGENFEFDPSCNFTFSDRFETSSGLKCEIESGMCSNFSNRGELEVTCDDGSDEDEEVPCPSE